MEATMVLEGDLITGTLSSRVYIMTVLLRLINSASKFPSHTVQLKDCREVVYGDSSFGETDRLEIA